MAIDEYSRHQLHTRLEQVLGADDAATLMASLPPIAWADLATKADLQSELHGLETRLLSELRVHTAELRGEFRSEVRTQSRNLFLSLVGLQISAAGLVVAVSKFV
jgi:hypothetical protein